MSELKTKTDEDFEVFEDDEFEIEVDDADNESEDAKDEDADEEGRDTESEEEADASGGEDDSDEDSKKPRKSRTSRSSRRIHQLREEVKRLREENSQITESTKAQTEAMKKRAELETKRSEQISKLRSDQTTVSAALAAAIENDDPKAQAEAHAKLQEVGLKIAALESLDVDGIVGTSSEYGSVSKTEARRAPQLPEEAIEFMEDNAWIQEPLTADEKKLRREYRKLLKTKYDEDDFHDPEFYEELREEVQNIILENGYQIEGYDVAPKSKKQKTSPTKSRQTKTGGGKNVIRVTKQDKEFAEKMGLDLKEYAKYKRQYEKVGATKKTSSDVLKGWR